MTALLVTIGAFVLVALVARDASWGVLAMAAALPVTQSVDTAIPGLNPFNVLLFSMVLGLFFRPRVPTSETDRFPAYVPALLFGAVILFGYINGSYIQRVPIAEDVRPFSRAASFLMFKEMWCLILLMFLTFWAARTPAEVRRYMDLIVLGMSAEVLFCIVEYARKLGRITGHVRQPNSLGALMGIIALTAAALFMAERKPKRWLYFAVAVGGSFSCVMSRSRGGLLALFAGLLVLSLFRNRKLFVIIAILGASYRLWLPVSVLQRIDEAYVVDEAGRVEAADTAAQRLTIWRSGMAMIQDRPLGVGLGAFPYFSALYGTILEMRHPDKSAHNEFLRVAAELGVVGFAAFTWLLLRLALSSWRASRRGREIELNGVAFAGLGALIGMSLSSISGTFFFQATISGHFWMVMGLLARSECLSRPEERPQPEQVR